MSSHEIQISVSINKVLLDPSHAHDLPIVYGCFHAIAAEFNDYNKDLLAHKA